MHTVKEKHRLLARVRRLQGQLRSVERAFEEEADCDEVLHLLAGARGALSGLMVEVVEDHVRSHLVDSKKYPRALDDDAVERLLEVVRTYLR